MDHKQERAIVIDGNAIIYKAFYAASYKKDADQAVIMHDTCSIIQKIIENLMSRHEYKYGVCVFDSSKKTFRKELFNDYKANRPPMPTMLVNTLSKILFLVKKMNLAVVFAPSLYEGDDVVGTLSEEFTRLEVCCDIYTTDRDLLQLVNHQVNVNLLQKGIDSTIEYSHSNFLSVLDGILPYQIPFLKSLSGDSSDNYKGMPGLGEKKATEIVKKFKNKELLFEKLKELPEKTQETIQTNKKELELFYKIATIVKNVPIEMNLNSFDIAEIKKNRNRSYE